MSNRHAPVRDDYLDALALARATLRGDDDGVLSIAQHCNPALMMQALTQLYLGVIFTATGQQSRGHVDAYLDVMLREFPADERDDEDQQP